MISISGLVEIVLIEAVEHSGVQEVPDHKHGAEVSYHASKRDARGAPDESGSAPEESSSFVQYRVELVHGSGEQLAGED